MTHDASEPLNPSETHDEALCGDPECACEKAPQLPPSWWTAGGNSGYGASQ